MMGCLFRGADAGACTETLYHRDDALLYIAYVMLIWAAPSLKSQSYLKHEF